MFKIFWRQAAIPTVIWLTLTILTIAAPLWVNSKALLVSYDGQLHSPVLGKFLSGRDFGYDYDYEVDYRALAQKLKADQSGWVLMPPIPYDAMQNALRSHSPERYAPTPPDLEHRNLLGTDPLGRDILARIVYGYRNALVFSGGYLLGLFVLGTLLGMAFGWWGGALDFWGQRLIEIWSNIPFLYIVMIVASMVSPNLLWLIILTLAFSWTGIAAYVRTLTFREKTRDFVQAARISGASSLRIMVRHLLPQMGTLLLTFLPFQAVGAISTLTSLDFLGFGLRPPAASWGELLRTGSANLHAPWIVLSVVVAMGFILLLLTIIGNALREAFDAKAPIRYK